MVFCFNRNTIHFKIKAVYITPFVGITEIKGGAAIFQYLVSESGLVIFIGIRPEMYPDEAQGIRGMVKIIHLHISFQRIVCLIKCDINFIINLLLPVRRQLTVSNWQLAEKEY